MVTFCIFFLAAACTRNTQSEENDLSEPVVMDTVIVPVNTITPANEVTSLPRPRLTEVPVSTDIPLAEVSENTFLNPAGCKRPSDDYSLIEGDYWTLNQRTFEMLEYAAVLYQGEIDLTGHAITQGSYSNGEPQSFGTHSGGGAVDISVMREGSYTVLYPEIFELVRALRAAGFAAWFRDFDEVYLGSPVHIHAIAIGDEQLSDAAENQLIGDSGYFKGLSGLFDEYGNPGTDRFGGPILCDWMLDIYQEEIFIPEQQSYESIQLISLNYLPGSKTSFLFNQYSNDLFNNSWYSIVNGEVINDILREAGKLPEALLSDFRGKNFVERFRIFSDSQQTWYEKIDFSESFLNSRKELAGIKPGDILLLNGDNQTTSCKFENIFLVTRLDENGLPWSVGVQKKDGEMSISEIELFSDEGCFNSGISGASGFIWYKRISAENEGFFYSVEPGDSLKTISLKFDVDIQELVLANQLTNKDLKTGQELIIP